MSCYCCGAKGHRGEDCPHETRPHLSAERQGDVKRAQVWCGVGMGVGVGVDAGVGVCVGGVWV